MKNGILKGMSATAFFNQHALPVFDCLSGDTKRQLEIYLAEGNTAFRSKKLLEFFRTIDWLSAEDEVDARPLQKLSPLLQRQLQREVADYRMRKAESRAENAEKRAQYRLRVFEYFRIKMPPADKALLESLRDYELNLTGRDVNWRHYFTLDSFKKIDAFRQASPTERQALFARFKKDVDTYKRNYDKIHQAQWARGCAHEFTFDDWCDMWGDEAPRSSGTRQGKQNRHASIPTSSITRACQILEVSLDTPPEAVKKQFRMLTLRHHPDLPSGSEEKMKLIVGAYQELRRYWQQGGL